MMDEQYILNSITNRLSSFEVMSDILAEQIALGIVAAAILVISLVLYIVARALILRVMSAIARRTPVNWDNILVECGMFHRLASLVPAIIVNGLAEQWMGEGHLLTRLLIMLAQLWLLLFGILFLHSALDGINRIYNTLKFARELPIKSFIQVIKLLLSLAGIIVAVAILLGRSPALIFSGLGAMTAVLMLVFRDPLLGFVAGIQLSANRMLSVGDWLEMPRYNADGDVIDITLTTVKVRNWDQTITTVPTYALISDSFKNWRGMTEAGGRRIMRNINIDMNSVRFLNKDDLKRLKKAQLITKYIDDKISDIDRHNRENSIDPDSPVNGRHLTNLGTFRAYILAYLKSHPGIHRELITMVRQLQPGAEGIPLQIYAFTADTAWVVHEGVQSDIFDHLLAIVKEFDLRVFQAPAGMDIRQVVAAGHASK